MKIQNIKKGFTLIELLVVITIMGILATGATAIYTSQIQKARDSTRMGDVKSLQSAIEQFYQDTTLYPIGKDNFTNSGTTSVIQYLPNLAQDPKHNQTCNGSRCGYIYIVNSDTNGILQGTYEVSTAFENQGNIDSKAMTDTGEDTKRLEVGLNNNTNITTQAQATAFAGAAANNTTNPLVIIRSNVVTK